MSNNQIYSVIELIFKNLKLESILDIYILLRIRHVFTLFVKLEIKQRCFEKDI